MLFVKLEKFLKKVKRTVVAQNFRRKLSGLGGVNGAAGRLAAP